MSNYIDLSDRWRSQRIYVLIARITLKDIQVWLGRNDFSTAANTYSHLDETSEYFSISALEKAITF